MTSNPAAPAVEVDEGAIVAHSRLARHTTFNLKFAFRGCLVSASTLPVALYTIVCVGTATFDQYYVLSAAAPAFPVIGYYMFQYTAPGCSILKTSHSLLRDSESYFVPKFQQITRRWLWIFHLAAPLASVFVLIAFSFVCAHVRGNIAPTFRFYWAFTWLTVISTSGAGAVLLSWNHAAHSEERWAAEKAAFAAEHDNAEELVDVFERHAVERADAATVRSIPRLLFALVLTLMTLLSGAVSQIAWFNNHGEWPVWVPWVFTLIACIISFPAAWTILTMVLVVMPAQYGFCSRLARAVSKCTNARDAKSEGLPHLVITDSAQLWKWYKLRQLFVTKRFNMTYNLCAPIVAGFTAFTMAYLLMIVLLVFAYNVDMLSLEWQIFLVIAFDAVVMLIYLLSSVASVYQKQQSQVSLLMDAKADAIFAAVRKAGGGTAQHAATMQQCLCETIEKQIIDEKDSPHVFGIPVKPTFFFVVIGYIGAAISAFAIGYIRSDIADL